MSWLKELKVGDQVFLRYSRGSREGRHVVVEKVGRKWITLSDYSGRVDRDQPMSGFYAKIDQEYGSPDVIFKNEQEFKQSGRILRLRRDIEQSIRSLGAEQVEAIAAIIGIE